MDEPASALDPIATQRIEELIYQLKRDYTIVIVTHNMQQAARVSDVTAFFWLGQLVEVGTHGRDLHEPAREADRRLRDRPVRLDGRGARMTQDTRHFAEELEELKQRLLVDGRAGRGARARRRCARWSTATRDLMADVIRGDEAINQLHLEIDDRCFKLLALHQPMADRSADHRRGRQDQQRSRARRRSRGQHRRGGRALRRASARSSR